MMTTGIIRILLVVDIIAIGLLALIYLRQRKMSWIAYLGWGIVAVTLPIIGPFLVIASRPGKWDPSYSIKSDFYRLVNLLQRVLPGPPPEVKYLRSDRSPKFPGSGDKK